MTEYRPLPDDRRDVLFEYVSYAFSPTDGPPEYDPDEHDTPRARMGSPRGLYPDGAPAEADPLSVCKHHWFDARVRGDLHPVPGLSAVATPPEHRRSGYVRDLLEGALEEYRDRNARFSVLWPFRYRFYRQYGWDTANRTLAIDCEPEALASAAADGNAGDGGHGREDGQYRRIEAGDYDRLEAAYEADSRRYGLSIDRTDKWWRHRVFERWDDDPFVYGWERAGEIRGYLVYRISGEWGDRTMHVDELAAVDSEAYRRLLAFCGDHDSQVNAVRLREPEDSLLPDIATDPDELDCELEDGPMVRIVDIAQSLSALSYPETDLDVRLAVSDPLADWNDGVFALSIDDGVATCERIHDEPSSGDADARLDIAALSQLAVGARSAGRLERTGRLEGAPAAVDALGRAFSETEVYLRDGF
ncbi:enhanced intracellular survival protein Eis [Saliphagus sp. LR7]|uniref:GNAT family N-acetyltransferase n=1 Tax=Saliphagus sp. LR7 TaxID=2282654 RepID=UPI000DF7F28F|nr:GNAT family N-acetyltransferase [Saliphagus sp. LR7]